MGKGKRSSEGQYINLSYAQIKSPAWRSLSGSAVKLWCELHSRFNGCNNGKITLSFAEASENLGMGKATIQRAYIELISHGFIVLMKEGNWYHRQAHEWRLTTKSTQGVKGTNVPTNDWRGFQPPKKTKRGSNSEPSGALAVPFQNPSGFHGSVIEPVRAKK